MEQQKLPNVTLALVLVILGFLCCCVWGLPGAILGLIAFILVRKDEKTYIENPEGYSNYSTLKTVKTLSIVVMILGVLMLAYILYTINAMGGWEAYMEKSQEIMEQWGMDAQ